MTTTEEDRNRRSIRLPGYDYTLPGGYSVTIVTWKRECLFGEVVKERVLLNDHGAIALEQWFKTAELRKNIELRAEEFVVMPNHIHGIIWIVDDPAVGAERRSAPTTGPSALGVIVRAYKSAVAYAINAHRGVRGEAVWQRNYYEHILRDQPDWESACNYIRSNPSRWADDDENLQKLSTRAKK